MQLAKKAMQLAKKAMQLAKKAIQLAKKATQLAKKATQLAKKATQLAKKAMRLATGARARVHPDPDANKAENPGFQCAQVQKRDNTGVRACWVESKNARSWGFESEGPGYATDARNHDQGYFPDFQPWDRQMHRSSTLGRSADAPLRP